MGKSRSKRRRSRTSKLALAGLAALGVATAAVVVVAVSPPPAPPPVSEQVSNYVPPTAAPIEAPEVAGFLGDSFTAGDGLADRKFRWTTVLAGAEGWTEINAGSGGTGYETAGRLDARKPYTGRIEELAAKKPTIVVISGGGNDLGMYRTQPAKVEAAVQSTYQQVRAALPEARIIGLSSDWGSVAPDPQIDSLDNLIEATVTGVGGEFIDLDRPLDGHPEFIGPDGAHPTNEGHAAIAEAAYAAIPKR